MKDKSKAELTLQVNHLSQALIRLTIEMENIKKDIAVLGKVAHFHGEPQVAERLQSEAVKEEQLVPSWEKKEFSPEISEETPAQEATHE